jgi:hypothetical protein
MATYYIRSNGSDNQSGLSDSSAWKTISKINASTYFEGDYILFNSSDRFVGELNITSSGTSRNYITYSYYGTGANPIIDASALYPKCVSISNKSYIIIDGINFANATQYGIIGNTSTNNIIVRNSSISNFGLDAINLPGGNETITLCTISNIGQHAINLSNENLINYSKISDVSQNAINLSGINNTITYCTISNIKNSAIGSSNNNTSITYCTISDVSQGISSIGGRGTINFCNISNVNQNGINVNSSNNTVTNNVISYTGRTYGSGIAGIFIDNSASKTEIAYNKITNTGGIGELENCHSIYVNGLDISVHHNTINNSQRGSGILFKGSGACYNNSVTSSYFAGIQFGHNDLSTSTVVAYNNVITHNNRGVYCQYHGTPNPLNITLYNNTFYMNDDTSRNITPCEIDVSSDLTSLIIKNNIIYSASDRYTYNLVLQSNASINNNLIYHASGDLIFYDGSIKSWATWQSYGYDSSGINSDPSFVSSTNYNLQSSSLCIGAGASVGIISDYDGKTRTGYSDITGSYPDIGAYEYSSVLFDIILSSGDQFMEFELPIDGSLYAPKDIISDANGMYELPYVDVSVIDISVDILSDINGVYELPYVSSSTGADILSYLMISERTPIAAAACPRIFIDVNGRVAIRLNNQLIKLID